MKKKLLHEIFNIIYETLNATLIGAFTFLCFFFFWLALNFCNIYHSSQTVIQIKCLHFSQEHENWHVKSYLNNSITCEFAPLQTRLKKKDLFDVLHNFNAYIDKPNDILNRESKRRKKVFLYIHIFFIIFVQYYHLNLSIVFIQVKKQNTFIIYCDSFKSREFNFPICIYNENCV